MPRKACVIIPHTTSLLYSPPPQRDKKVEGWKFIKLVLQSNLKHCGHVYTISQTVSETAGSTGRRMGCKELGYHQPARSISWIVPKLNWRSLYKQAMQMDAKFGLKPHTKIDTYTKSLRQFMGELTVNPNPQSRDQSKHKILSKKGWYELLYSRQTYEWSKMCSFSLCNKQ